MISSTRPTLTVSVVALSTIAATTAVAAAPLGPAITEREVCAAQKA